MMSRDDDARAARYAVERGTKDAREERRCRASAARLMLMPRDDDIMRVSRHERAPARRYAEKE